MNHPRRGWSRAFPGPTAAAAPVPALRDREHDRDA
jgi:hypothetical protein